jgi:lipoate-protein ligase B
MFKTARQTSSVAALARRWLSSQSASSKKPILYHHFEKPVPYLKGLALQEALVSRRSAAKTSLQSYSDGSSSMSPDELELQTALAAEDVVLLLEHEPVYTTGRRDTDPEVLEVERKRLTELGAEYIATQRGGQTTYHGPGQLVGYPILDTSLLDVSVGTHFVAIVLTCPCTDVNEAIRRSNSGLPRKACNGEIRDTPPASATPCRYIPLC